MSRNVEIKARVADLQKIIENARKMTADEGSELRQHDVFFASPNGRLKLREVTESGKTRYELIWYSRADIAGPKLSDFNKVEFTEEQAKEMKEMLTNSMGVKGEVRKIRRLFLYEQTRIHIDRVDGLGDFMELEVCLKKTDTVEDGAKIAEIIRNKLGIPDEDLLTGAYMDMLQE